jgi:PPP family 3-phenylpropionic acid transporter
MLYGFGTVYWRDQGIDATTIGALWAVGVVAEITLFTVAGRLQRRWGPAPLLAAAAIGGLVRWPVLAHVTWIPALVAAQVLHALTFGALHLGAMAYARARVEAEDTNTVTTLYSAAAAAGQGLTLLVAGFMYDVWAGQTYLAMAALSGAGLVGAYVLGAPNQKGSAE